MTYHYKKYSLTDWLISQFEKQVNETSNFENNPAILSTYNGMLDFNEELYFNIDSIPDDYNVKWLNDDFETKLNNEFKFIIDKLKQLGYKAKLTFDRPQFYNYVDDAIMIEFENLGFENYDDFEKFMDTLDINYEDIDNAVFNLHSESLEFWQVTI